MNNNDKVREALELAKSALYERINRRRYVAISDSQDGMGPAIRLTKEEKDLILNCLGSSSNPWQSISTAPKDERLLVTNGADVNTAEFTENLDWWIMSPQQWAGDGETGEITKLEFNPTHWQPLPAPPEEHHK